MTEEQRLFVADAQEIVERLCRDLEQLRGAQNQGRRRRELAAQIFRRVHTLKGSGASLGFKSVSSIAHEFEGVLDGVRLGRVELSDAVLDKFEDALDGIAGALQAAPSDKVDRNLDSVIQRLKALAEQSKKQGAIESGLRTALPADIARELSKLLGQSGEIIATVPGEAANADEINFRLLYAAELLATEVLRQASTLGRIDHRELPIQAAATQPLASTEASSTQTSPAANVEAPVRI